MIQSMDSPPYGRYVSGLWPQHNDHLFEVRREKGLSETYSILDGSTSSLEDRNFTNHTYLDGTLIFHHLN